MGVSELWSFLRGVGAMREWSADSEGTAGVQKACAAQVKHAPALLTRGMPLTHAVHPV